jgi:hypothetical protein
MMKHIIQPQPEDTRTPYKRFEDLTRQLLTVSKEELDKRQAEYERKKKRKRKKPKPL